MTNSLFPLLFIFSHVSLFLMPSPAVVAAAEDHRGNLGVERSQAAKVIVAVEVIIVVVFMKLL